MPIDNEVYDRHGESWWDEADPLNMLHGSMTPGRFAYFREVIARDPELDLQGLPTLDIGSGGGFLAEEFAKLGCRVVGVDPSTVSVDTARRHAASSGLDIEYRVGTGEALPVGDAEFGLAYSCDVLEHVDDLDTVVSEVARALRPGGVFLFDTINRTRMSRIIIIKLMQEWRLTRIIDASLHEWSMFIPPDDLTATMARHGLHAGEIVGLGPRIAKPLVVWNFLLANRGRISYGELSRRLDVGQVGDLGVSYMGFATKAASRDVIP